MPIAEDRGAGAAPAAADSPLQAVVVAIGEQRYGLPVELVREIVPLPALLELAGAAATVCGALNRHGAYIPVIDGRAMVGQPSHATLDSLVVLAGAAQPQLGLLVDGVSGVRQFAASQCTRFDGQTVASFLAGIASGDDGPVLLLHVPALLGMIPALARQQP
ncbi:MAG TPA: chemotaxis protein CheW [Herpetosiphonaceae bacterium]|nr:chemotaxis protein CheW [Herpetosiphonaceae bacterium]